MDPTNAPGGAMPSADARYPDDDPLRRLAQWCGEVRDANVPGAGTMMLATVDSQRRRSARIVTLPDIKRGAGIVFDTNTLSRKAYELLGNPKVALVLYWPTPDRQVRIEGRVEQLPADEVAAYFQERQRNSQCSDWASPQSCVIAQSRNTGGAVGGDA